MKKHQGARPDTTGLLYTHGAFLKDNREESVLEESTKNINVPESRPSRVREGQGQDEPEPDGKSHTAAQFRRSK